MSVARKAIGTKRKIEKEANRKCEGGSGEAGYTRLDRIVKEAHSKL